MPFIRVHFKDKFLREVGLRTDPSSPVLIGRDPGRDISINEAGMSALHAVIFKEGHDFVIVDTASHDGVLINGEITHRKILRAGDTIELLGYTLTFAEASASAQCAVSPKRSHENRNSGSEPENAKVEGFAKRPSGSTAYLTLSQSKSTGRSEFSLKNVNVRIGKANYCDIRVGGWLAPPVIASVVRRTDGYYLKPEKRAKVRLNATLISELRKLANGDRVAVRDCNITFHEPGVAQRALSKT